MRTRRRWCRARLAFDGARTRRAAERIAIAIARDQVEGLGGIVRIGSWLPHAVSVRVLERDDHWATALLLLPRNLRRQGCKSKWRNNLRWLSLNKDRAVQATEAANSLRDGDFLTSRRARGDARNNPYLRRPRRPYLAGAGAQPSRRRVSATERIFHAPLWRASTNASTPQCEKRSPAKNQ